MKESVRGAIGTVILVGAMALSLYILYNISTIFGTARSVVGSWKGKIAEMSVTVELKPNGKIFATMGHGMDTEGEYLVLKNEFTASTFSTYQKVGRWRGLVDKDKISGVYSNFDEKNTYHFFLWKKKDNSTDDGNESE